jgi:hypothetical protein
LKYLCIALFALAAVVVVTMIVSQNASATAPTASASVSDPLINARNATLDLSVQYLAGGGAGLLPVKLRSEVRPKYISPLEGFDDFVFSNGPVKEGSYEEESP